MFTAVMKYAHSKLIGWELWHNKRFIMDIIEFDVSSDLKHKSWVNMYVKVDIQIVKLRQKTETHLLKSILFYSLGNGLTKFWNIVGMWQIGVEEGQCRGFSLNFGWNSNTLIWFTRTHLLVSQMFWSHWIRDSSLLFCISISSSNSACHLDILPF